MRITWVDIVILTFLLGSFGAIHLVISGRIPSGSDPGNWLALAHETLGDRVMSADVRYPPLFPALVGILIPLAGPLTALVVGALLAKSVLVAAIYVSTRPAGRAPALAAAVLVGTAGYQLEAYAWGAYPQLLATGLALMVIYFALRFVSTSRWQDLLLTLLASAMVFATHRLVAGLLLFALPGAIAHSLWLRRAAKRAWRRAALPIGGVALLGIPQLAYWLLAEARAGANPVLNPEGLPLSALLELTVREAPVPWILVALLATVGIFRRKWWSKSVSIPASMGTGWVLAGTGFFLITGAQRALLLVQMSLIVLAVLTFSQLVLGFLESTDQMKLRPVMLLLVGMSTFGWLVGAGWLLTAGISHYSASSDWYRVLDRNDLEMLGRLRQVSDVGDIVVASRGSNGNPVGWWVEGYGQRPTYSAIDTRYVTFSEEKRQGVLANAIFGGRMSVTRTTSLLKSIGARFVVVDRRGPDADWLRDADRYGLTLLFDSRSLVILGSE